MSNEPFPVRNLAAAFLAGTWKVAALVRRGTQACGQRPAWLRPLTHRLLNHFGAAQRPDEPALLRFLRGDRAFYEERCGLGVSRIFWVSETMAPPPGAPLTWRVPALSGPLEVAEWLGLTPPTLDWFADSQRRNRHAPPGPLRHYTHRWLTRANGKARLLEIPKPRLKHLQRRLLHDLLDFIPPHEAVHGYRRGRSLATCVAPHAGRRIVLHMDLHDFFPAVQAARVHAVFRTAGYPPAVARLLTGLCTTATAEDAFADLPSPNARVLPWNSRQRYRSPHLPQGAPTSPALANLCAYALDCRLAGLARSVNACYTRYADDLIFSGSEELERCIRRFQVGVCCLALEEGFEVHTRKSHFMRQGVRQQVAGIVLNVRPNIARRDFDALKATLTNCVRHGPHTQNRAGHSDFRSHLAGRIAYVAMLNPARGQRLRNLFAQVRWDATA